jgi:CelD/BcsL family acetyltransferase involved in cellulose biosynthesis
MKITRIRANEIDASLARRWTELQAADPELGSPYFSVEYTQAVARAGRSVFVGLVEAEGQLCGIFPFEQVSRTVIGPVGGRLSDCHGALLQKGLELSATDLVRGCGYQIWDFDHVPAGQRLFEPYTKLTDQSPIMELQQGYAGYLEQRKAAGAQRVSQMLRKARKFEREVGPLRFEANTRDPRVFKQVVEWKREQCLRTGVPDFLSWGWPTDLLEQVAAVDTPAFAGKLSVLWHEDTILAAHFGMRSSRVWHWWFPGYNDAYSEFSPGGILLLRVAETAAADGMHYVDLGKGDDAYKRSFATGSLGLLEGSVLVPSLRSTWRKLSTSSKAFLRESPVLAPVRAGYRQVRDRISHREWVEVRS